MKPIYILTKFISMKIFRILENCDKIVLWTTQMFGAGYVRPAGYQFDTFILKRLLTIISSVILVRFIFTKPSWIFLIVK